MSSARGANKSKTPDSNKKKEETKSRPSARVENARPVSKENLKGKASQASEAKPSMPNSLFLITYLFFVEVKKTLTQAVEESKTPEKKQKKGPKSEA